MPPREIYQTHAGKHLWKKEAATFKPRGVSTQAYSLIEPEMPYGGSLLEIAPGNGEGLLRYMHKPTEIHLADISKGSVR